MHDTTPVFPDLPEAMRWHITSTDSEGLIYVQLRIHDGSTWDGDAWKVAMQGPIKATASIQTVESAARFLLQKYREENPDQWLRANINTLSD